MVRIKCGKKKKKKKKKDLASRSSWQADFSRC
jgi:hypothetical protein